MKKYLSILLLFTLLFCLTGCFKSEEAKNADALIDAIGEVTLDSEDAIDKAEKEVKKLTPEQKEELDNEEDLIAARETFTDLTFKDTAAKLVDRISKIGNVTLDSEKVITDIKKDYEKLSLEYKKYVTNYDSVFLPAYNKFSDLKKEADRLAKIERENTIKNGLAKMRSKTDEVQNITWYLTKAQPVYINSRSYILPYIGKKGNSYDFRVKFVYTGDNWVFFENLIFNIDGVQKTKSFNYFSLTRDNAHGDVWEYADELFDSENVSLLTSIANSKKTIVRFRGDSKQYDLTISEADKQAIREVLNIYNAYNK
ncbi:MAG: hypothetical protein IKU84_07090 [Clostridia bacterium]|nr:hypothetical protein [Clostridia bacterium]